MCLYINRDESIITANIYYKRNYNMQITEELQDLFELVRVKIGGGIRQVELDDNVLCKLLQLVVNQYDMTVQGWILQYNWLNMMGKTAASLLNNPQELSYAMTFGAMDMSKDYSQWFSRDVGLQQRGSKYELKKDFITIEKGKQCYLVPAGREIVKVMWMTPSTSKVGLMGTPMSMGGFGYGMGVYGDMVLGQPAGWLVGGLYDSMLTAVDMKNKNSMLRSDLVYKVTALETGEHLIHLLSVPGSPNQLHGGVDDASWGWQYHGCNVWYTYYDVGTNQDDIDACRRENKSDIIISPDQVPMNGSSYEFMNPQAKATIQQLLIAEAMQTIGLIRGYASGTISIPDAQMTLDYNLLITQGKEIKDTTMNDLKERLQKMLPWEMMKNYADMTDSLQKILSQKPLGIYVI